MSRRIAMVVWRAVGILAWPEDWQHVACPIARMDCPCMEGFRP